MFVDYLGTGVYEIPVHLLQRDEYVNMNILRAEFIYIFFFNFYSPTVDLVRYKCYLTIIASIFTPKALFTICF